MLERLRGGAGKCAVASLWPLSDNDLAVAIEQVHRLEQTLAAVKLHLINEIGDRGIPTAQFYRGTAAWLRSRLLLDPATARRLVEQAAEIRRHPAVDAALGAGAIQLRQAAAICETVDALPSTAELAALPAIVGDDAAGSGDNPACPPAHDPAECSEVAAGSSSGGSGDAGGGVIAAELAAAAEETLLRFAGEFAPAPLRRLGVRILDHVAPEVADRLDAIALERAERRAWPARGLTLSPPASGLVRISGHLTVEDAATVTAVLDPLTSPRYVPGTGTGLDGGRDAGTGHEPDGGGDGGTGLDSDAGRDGGTGGDTRSPAQRRADALVEVCRLALRTGELPASGGEPPQLTVTVAYDPLNRALGVGRLDSGDRVSPATVRRLACDAQIMPVVLDGASQVLDAGRSRRLATGPLRRALVVRDRGCSFPACDRPPRWCDGHHVRPWSAGGRTRLDNLVLLCRHHHRLIHDGDWTVRIGTDGLPEFLPPAVPGEPRDPRRNRYHRRT
jgi:Domain of unknown function (DUF222)/HNH endonuclease